MINQSIFRKKFCLLMALFFLMSMSGPIRAFKQFAESVTSSMTPENLSPVRPSSLQLPILFMPNAGLLQEDVIYQAPLPEGTLQILDSKIRLLLPDRPDGCSSYQLEFPGSRKTNPLIADQTGGYVNMFIGDDPEKWKTRLEMGRSVIYKGLYQNVDLKIYAYGDQIEYDWIVYPGGDPSRIRIRVKSDTPCRLNQDGDIEIKMKTTRILQKKPRSHQVIAGQRVAVDSSFNQTETGLFGVEVLDFDKSVPLIIDPEILVYSTLFPSTAAYDVAIDSDGYFYITGRVFEGERLITKNPFQEHRAGGWGAATDAYVAKFAPDGQSLIFSTYLGGQHGDSGHSIAVAKDGAVYMTGYTYSWDFPVKNAVQPTNGGYKGSYDAFATKLSPDGTSLEYSTYLGGGYHERGYDIAVDGIGNAYVTGRTLSDDFPTVKAFQGRQGNSDCFISKFSSSGDKLLFSTYLGGRRWEEATAVTVDKNGDIYLTGFTDSPNFPLKNSSQNKVRGVCDTFVSKLRADGSSPTYSVLIGGSLTDRAYDITVDDQGCAHISGATYSGDFPCVNAIQKHNRGGADAFVSSLSPLGAQLLFSTYLGGAKDDHAFGLALGAGGSIFITGRTFSPDFPTWNAYQNVYNAGLNNAAGDAFIALISKRRQLLSSTFFGGSRYDAFFRIGAHANGKCFAAGETFSSGRGGDFPLLNPLAGRARSCGLHDSTLAILSAPILNRPIIFPFFSSGRSISITTFTPLKSNFSAFELGATTFTYRPEALFWPSFRIENRVEIRDFVNQFIISGGSNCGDFDNDGDLDLVITAITKEGNNHTSGDSPSHELILLMNNCGVFQDETDKRISSINNTMGGEIKIGDVDGDNDLDIMIAAYGVEYTRERIYFSENDKLLINNGKGYFSDEGLSRLPKKDIHYQGSGVEFADIDQDGDLDICSGNRGEIDLNNGRGYFKPDNSNKEIHVIKGSYQFTLFDFNKDTYSDLILSVNNNLVLFINNKGIFSPPEILRNVFPPSKIIVADINKDSNPDILSFLDYNPNRKGGVILLINKGNLKFIDKSRNLNQGVLPDYSTDAVTGDVDKDGNLDIIVTGVPMSDSSPSLQCRFFLNQGGLRFINVINQIPELNAGASILLKDFDSDGDLDIFLSGCDPRAKYFENTMKYY